jgi:PBSX family phage terminase large subunit
MTAVLERPTTPTHRYEPWGAALEAFAYRGPELLLSGPAGTGKSRALIEKMHLMCLSNPGMRALMVRKVRDTLTNTGLVTYREHVAKEAIERGDVSFYGGSASEPAQFRYPNGATINIGGMDKPTKIMSSEYDIAYVQEAIELTETDWENLTTRLRNGRVSFQQLMADTNPDAPTHWLKARVDRGITHMLDTRHEDNPILCAPDGSYTTRGAAYMSALDNLTGVRKDRLRYGRWAAAEGMVYEGWDRTLHLRKIVDPPHHWERYWSVDFGYTNPFVLQCWAVDEDGRLHLYRELYRSRRLVEDHARDIMSIVAPGGRWREPKPRAVICDHDAEDRATLERHLEMATIEAQKTVSDGIQAVQQRLKPAGDGRPRIYLSPVATVERDPEMLTKAKPTCTADEFPGYVWDKPKEGSAAAEKAPKEEPRKLDDHGVDALRYMVAHLDLAPKPRMRGWL